MAPTSKRDRTNREQLGAVAPLAEQLVRFLIGRPGLPFHGLIRIDLIVHDDTIQCVRGKFKGGARPAPASAVALARVA